MHSQPLEAAASDGVDQADARDFVTGAIRARLAGWRGVDAKAFEGAPPVGVNGMIDSTRKIARALRAGSRTTEPIVGRALTGSLDGWMSWPGLARRARPVKRTVRGLRPPWPGQGQPVDRSRRDLYNYSSHSTLTARPPCSQSVPARHISSVR
jgi:hypothetical protein